MAEYLIQDTTLTGIADAIREKTGGTDPVAVSDMAAQIEGIQAGGGGDDVLNALIDRSITEISSSSATSIGSYAFYFCVALTTADFPVATSIGSYAFYFCHALTTADFPVATSIESNAFRSCNKLKSLLLRGNNVCTLSNTNAFGSTPIASGTGYIYVPSSLIEQYKAATNWSTYADHFRALEDYTIDGTVTGKLDPAKIGT